MKLIFRIAAGIIIGLMAYQIIALYVIDARHEEMGDTLTKAANLKVGAIRIMSMVHEYYGEHRELPKSLAELNCPKSDPCDYHKQGSRFYASFEDDWIAVEPIVVLGEPDFNCSSTVLPLYDPGFLKCTRLDDDDIPDFN